MQKTFTFGSIEITVQTAQTIRDELNADVISQQASALEPVGAWHYCAPFGNLCAHTVSAKGLPFDPVALPGLPAVQIHEAYQHFLTLNKRLKALWTDACNEVDKEDFDAALGPSPLAENADPN